MHIYFMQSLVSITDNVYNPSNQAAYSTLDGGGEVSHWVNHLMYVAEYYKMRDVFTVA